MKKLVLTALASLALTIMLKATTDVDTSFVVNGTSHNLLFSLPENYDSENTYPLVIGIHYCGGTADQYRNALHEFADSLNVVVACPDYSSEQVPNADSNMFKILVDSAYGMYSIDTNSVYLNGMSCNAEFGLRQGLKKTYPFKGIFLWAPWASSSSPDLYDYDSDMPTVISIGTSDVKLIPALNICDSLKTHEANADLILLPGITHTLDFDAFANTMIKSYYYLTDTNSITLSAIEDMKMKGNETKNLSFTYGNTSGKDIKVNVTSSHTSRIPSPAITINSNTVEFTLEAKNTSGTVTFVVEVSEVGGTGIEQSTFKVVLEKQEEQVNSSDDALLSAVKIYPNPVTSELYIENLSGKAEVTLINLTGKVMYSNVVNNGRLTIPTSTFNAGLYIMQIESQEGIETHQIVVQ